MKIVHTGALHAGGVKKALQRIGAKSHNRRLCVLIAPDNTETGPCVLQMYKAKVGSNPTAIISIRDCHALLKLEPSSIKGKPAQFANFGFVMKTSSGEFSLLAESAAAYHVWLTALLSLLDPTTCHIDTEFRPFSSRYSVMSARGGDSSDSSDSKESSPLSASTPAGGGAGMPSPEDDLEDSREVTLAGTPQQSRRVASGLPGAPDSSPPLSRKQEIARLKAQLLQATDTIARLERENRRLREHGDMMKLAVPIGSLQSESTALLQHPTLSRAMRGQSIIEMRTDRCRCTVQ